MKSIFNSEAMSDMITAISEEMLPHDGVRRHGIDTLFIGCGSSLHEGDRHSFEEFGRSRNYNIILASFDASNVEAGPVGITAVITDGLTKVVTLYGGQLWKRDKKSASILVFPQTRTRLSISGKNKVMIREMTGPYHDQGFTDAYKAVIARAASKPGEAPVVTSIGDVLAVMDSSTLKAMWANA